MKKIVTLLAAFIVFAGLTAPAFAQGAVEEKNLLSGKEKFDPASGYIFQRGPMRTNGMFLKVADDVEKADYEKQWAEELAKEQKKYAKKLESWERDAKAAKRDNVKIRPKPEEPTAENFTIGPIELLHPVSFGPQFVFSKGKDPEEYSYLNQVKPGTYIYYGPIMIVQAAVGQCYCMGSVKFEVKPGVITDLGNFFFTIPVDDPAFPRNNEKPSGSEAGLYGVYFASLPREKQSYGVPDSLKSYPYANAELHASGKLENFYGITVSRMPPVPGVLAYDRDKVIDLAAPMAQPASEAGAAAAATAAAAAPGG